MQTNAPVVQDNSFTISNMNPETVDTIPKKKKKKHKQRLIKIEAVPPLCCKW